MQEVQRILAGAEPFFFEGSSVGVLLCHGYTGSPHAMRYLGEQLNKRGGFTVHGPLLAGHGISPEVMGESTAQDWINSVDEALMSLREKCDKIFMIGLSMGGCAHRPWTGRSCFVWY
jgi:carboxylesterase